MCDKPSINRELKRWADKLGFAACRITTADPVPCDQLKKWLGDGRHGSMRYMERAPERRCEPASLLPGATSVICCALRYDERGFGSCHSDRPNLSKSEGEGVEESLAFKDQRQGILRLRPSGSAQDDKQIARFARGDDYHVVVREKLAALADALRDMVPDARTKLCVDTSPLLEKALAARAGLGWIGKNCLLINPAFGSWFVLGEIVTDAQLAADAPIEHRCGECHRCIDGCPTGALDGHMLDARRCISYLTIEHRQTPGAEYGCDLCQEACPFNCDP